MTWGRHWRGREDTTRDASIPIRVPGLIPTRPFRIPLPASAHLGRHRRWLKNFGSWHPSRKPALSSGLLALTWPSAGCWGHLRRSCLSLSAFKIRKNSHLKKLIAWTSVEANDHDSKRTQRKGTAHGLLGALVNRPAGCADLPLDLCNKQW